MVSVARFAPVGACRRVPDDHLRVGWVGRAGWRVRHRPGGRHLGAVHLGGRGPGARPAGGGGRGPALGWPWLAAPARPRQAVPALAGVSRAGPPEAWADWGGWGPGEERCSHPQQRGPGQRGPRPAVVVVEPRGWRLAWGARWRLQPPAVVVGPRHPARAAVARRRTRGWPRAGLRQPRGEREPGQALPPVRGLAAELERRRWGTRWWVGSVAWAPRRPARAHGSVATAAQPGAPRLASPLVGRWAPCRGWPGGVPGRRSQPWGWVGPGGAAPVRLGLGQGGLGRRQRGRELLALGRQRRGRDRRGLGRRQRGRERRGG